MASNWSHLISDEQRHISFHVARGLCRNMNQQQQEEYIHVEGAHELFIPVLLHRVAVKVHFHPAHDLQSFLDGGKGDSMWTVSQA